MSTIDRQIALVRRRLTMNLLVDRLFLAIAVAAGLGTLTVLVERAFVFGIPLQIMLGGIAGLALVVAICLAIAGRADRLAAAIEIDRAAGLKARVGSAVELSSHADDPFAQATRRDAEQVAARVHVPSHVPYRMSPRWPQAGLALCAVAIAYAFMPTLDLLAGSPDEVVEAKPASSVDREQAEQVVKEVAERTRQRLDKLAGLDDLDMDLGELALPEDPTMTPEDINREVAKRTENVAEKLREQLADTDLQSLDAVQRQLAQLQKQKGSDAASKLSEALARGDMLAAREAMSELQDQLEAAAENADESTKQQLAEAAQKLADLADQLDKLGNDEASKKELQNKAGMSDKEAEDLLKQMQNMSPEQVQQLLQKQLGQKLSEDQIKQMAQKLCKNQKACQQMKKMAKAMKQAAAACQNPGQGKGGTASAMGQLSQLEMAQQMAGELEAALGDIEGLQKKACSGSGLCKKPGNQWGTGVGPGYGPEQPVDPSQQYSSERVKGTPSAGQVIGEMLVDGSFASGEATAEMRDAVNSAMRDATDAIDRDEVPQQYHHLLRNYFAGLAGLVGEEAGVTPSDGDDGEAGSGS